MTDSSSHDAARTGNQMVDPERDAKIDELLLAGLEHYFAGRFQEAINVWGRVLFLDRGHARARAYIDRARSAQAERQRQSEEMLHEGVAAIQRGDDGAARELLESAAAHGDSPDVALAYLARLERLAGAAAPPAEPQHTARRSPRSPRVALPATLTGGRPRPVRVLPLVVVVVAVGGAVLFAAAFDLLKPLVDSSWGRPSAEPTVVVEPGALPLPRSAELTIARARALSATGHLRDALALLDRVPPGDPAFPQAEQQRAEIQRRLLETAGLGATPVAGGIRE
jgi:tetratricopeptide (TPR) repeat protein